MGRGQGEVTGGRSEVVSGAQQLANDAAQTRGAARAGAGQTFGCVRRAGRGGACVLGSEASRRADMKLMCPWLWMSALMCARRRRCARIRAPCCLSEIIISFVSFGRRGADAAPRSYRWGGAARRRSSFFFWAGYGFGKTGERMRQLTFTRVLSRITYAHTWTWTSAWTQRHQLS